LHRAWGNALLGFAAQNGNGRLRRQGPALNLPFYRSRGVFFAPFCKARQKNYFFLNLGVDILVSMVYNN